MSKKFIRSISGIIMILSVTLCVSANSEGRTDKTPKTNAASFATGGPNKNVLDAKKIEGENEQKINNLILEKRDELNTIINKLDASLQNVTQLKYKHYNWHNQFNKQNNK